LPVPVPGIDLQTDVTDEGELPSPISPPSGCRFRTRCERADALCAEVEPTMRRVSDEHFVACHHPLIDLDESSVHIAATAEGPGGEST